VLRIVTWKWRAPGYRTQFSAATVNVLRRAVRRHYDQPHQFVCVTDDPEGLDPDIEVVPLWSDWREIPSPHGAAQPSCYVRLKAFAPEMREVLGDRFVSIDLDAVIVGDLTPLFSRPEPFVIWRHALPGRQTNGPLGRYNGSMWMMTAGARSEVWTQFRGAASGREAYQAGQHGSDQGWMQHVMGPDEAGWTSADGVYSYKYQILATHGGRLPANARIVFFHGKPDPWDPEPQQRAWVREHWNQHLAGEGVAA